MNTTTKASTLRHINAIIRAEALLARQAERISVLVATGIPYSQAEDMVVFGMPEAEAAQREAARRERCLDARYGTPR